MLVGMRLRPIAIATMVPAARVIVVIAMRQPFFTVLKS